MAVYNIWEDSCPLTADFCPLSEASLHEITVIEEHEKPLSESEHIYDYQILFASLVKSDFEKASELLMHKHDHFSSKELSDIIVALFRPNHLHTKEKYYFFLENFKFKVSDSYFDSMHAMINLMFISSTTKAPSETSDHCSMLLSKIITDVPGSILPIIKTECEASKSLINTLASSLDIKDGFLHLPPIYIINKVEPNLIGDRFFAGLDEDDIKIEPYILISCQKYLWNTLIHEIKHSIDKQIEIIDSDLDEYESNICKNILKQSVHEDKYDRFRCDKKIPKELFIIALYSELSDMLCVPLNVDEKITRIEEFLDRKILPDALKNKIKEEYAKKTKEEIILDMQEKTKNFTLREGLEENDIYLLTRIAQLLAENNRENFKKELSAIKSETLTKHSKLWDKIFK